ncbi:MAG: peptidoglycan-binding protein [Sulfurovaceae bacterium]|nr:peptidoglycan-binding protein [Sulfurovaceae bacterium]
MTSEEFIQKLYPAAIKVSKETGMSWELILAQAAQETQWGKSVLPGTNNIFNIKASNDWHGETKEFRVWEIENGKKVWVIDEFRVYDSIEESLMDRVDFLKNNPRYTKAGLFDDGTLGNLEKEAVVLQKAGYATDPKYADNLIAVSNGPTMKRALSDISLNENFSHYNTDSNENNGVFDFGDKGDDVKELQSMLNDLGYHVTVDGIYGKQTEQAVKDYQSQNGLTVDGIVGKNTMMSLEIDVGDTLFNMNNDIFYGINGNLLGNIRQYDPQDTLSPYTSISSVSDLLESFQTSMVLNSMEAAQIYSSVFSGSSSEFKDFLFYSWDDKYEDNDFWLEKQDDYSWMELRDNDETFWISDEFGAIMTVNQDIFGDYYNSLTTNYKGTDISNSDFIVYSDWYNDVGFSFDGVSVNANYGSSGGNASFSFSFSFPVALDLDGDGIELTSVIDSKSWFDIAGDGTMHQTGWVGADDGLLAYDENDDGKITTAREIAFANRTESNDTDLEALRSEFDSNHDGKLDANDTEFDKFRIWQDKDSDGESDDGELITLTKVGIVSIDLEGTETSYAIDGNKINAFTAYTKTDGTTGMGADVALAYDYTGYTTTMTNEYMTVKRTGSEAVYAMATSATPLMLDLSIAKLDGAIGNNGNDTLDASSKSTSVILEGMAGDDVLKGGAGDDWLDGGEGVDTLEGRKGNDTYIVDNYIELNNIKEPLIGNDTDFNTVIYKGSDDLKIDIEHINVEAIYSGSGNDTIVYAYNFDTNRQYGKGYLSRNLVIDGGAGDDTIYGHKFNDLLKGGLGHDILNGRSGDDIYLFSIGDGVDTIAEFSEDYVIVKKHKWYQGTSSDKYGYIEANGGDDTIQFGEGITLDNIDIKLIGSDLLLGVRNAGDVSDIETLNDRILIKDFLNNLRTIENLSFSDKTTASLTTISGLNIGTSSNDTIIGLAGNDIINSKEGADKLSGGTGDDVFIFDTVFSMQAMGLTTVTFGTLSRSIYGMIEKSNGNIDTISDFEAGKDIIYLDNTIFKQLSDGPLSIDNFVANSTGNADDANDYIIYNTSNGKLSYDIDGNGKGMSVVFAILSNKPTDLSHQDFYTM